MKGWLHIRSFVWAGLGGMLGWLFGEMDGFFYALLAFVSLDYITGVLAAIVHHQLSSDIGFKGICRKIAIFCLVALANVMDVQLLGSGGTLRTAVIFFYLSNEGISVLENAARIGVPLPHKLKQTLVQLGKSDQTGQSDQSSSHI